ncbi:MAG: cobalt ECF transporter T component CbiQ [Treponemataceae bacterium]
MLIIDKYSYTNKLKDISPLIKFLIFVAGIILARQSLAFQLIACVIMFFLTVFVAGIKLKNYLSLFKIPLFFILLSVLSIALAINAKNFLWSFKIFGITLGVTNESLHKGIDIFFVSIVSVSSMYFFILTTPVLKIIKLLKKIKTPDIVIELMTLIYRSIFIFIDEYERMNRARILKFGDKKKSVAIKSISKIAAELFISVFKKHNQMSLSLELKFYNGKFTTGKI